MKLRFVDARTWRYAIVAISKIVDEATYKFTEEGIVLRAIDPSRIVLVDFQIPRSSMIFYEVKGVETVTVNMEDLAKIVRRAVKGDELELSTLEAGRLAVTFHGRGSRTFILPSLETTVEEAPELNIEFSVRAKFSPPVFRDIVKELEPVSDAIEFVTNRDENKIIARASSDVAEVEIEASIENGALIELEATENARAVYTIDYLKDITSAIQIAEELVFEYGTSIPCKITTRLPHGGLLTFYVAPRVE
ncbi:MAG: DNA polymerase sliding clamp [Desulfurococcaceae archaeon]